MSMKKKIILLFLILTLALLGTSCDKNRKDDTKQEQGSGQNETQDDGFYFPGSDIPGGIVLPEDTFE